MEFHFGNSKDYLNLTQTLEYCIIETDVLYVYLPFPVFNPASGNSS